MLFVSLSVGILPISSISCYSFLLYSLFIFLILPIFPSTEFRVTWLEKNDSFSVSFSRFTEFPLNRSNPFTQKNSQQNELDIITCLMAYDYLYDPRKWKSDLQWVSQSHSNTYTSSVPFPVSAQRLTANGKCNPTRKLLKWRKKIEHFRLLQYKRWVLLVAYYIIMSKRRYLLFFVSKIFSLLAIFEILFILSSGVNVSIKTFKLFTLIQTTFYL